MKLTLIANLVVGLALEAHATPQYGSRGQSGWHGGWSGGHGNPWWGSSNGRALPLVTPNGLKSLVSLDQLVSGSQRLQDIAYSYPERNRVFGSKAHNDTVDFLYNTIAQFPNYYNVYRQPFVELYARGDGNFSIAGVEQKGQIMTYSPAGTVLDTTLVVVDNLGCDPADYPASVVDAIAIISRGTCQFGLKSALAGAAGAAGVVIYDNVEEDVLSGTLGSDTRPEGRYVPTVGIPLANGLAIVAELASNPALTGDLIVDALYENRTTFNVIAQTKGGDQNNVIALGGHTDSVDAGPGINDDGSGSIGILDVAISLTNFTTTNAVRFCWWSAEEYGLLGSTYYVESLNDTEVAKIRAYLNFDMIASPNFAYQVYDGDGSTFGTSGPPGSDAIEAGFNAYYASQGLEYNATAFDGRSDYGPFLDVDIASGGLFTGAEEIKTAGEVVQFGGTAGISYDPNYHAAGDTVENLSLEAFLVNTESIAWSIGTYATDLSSIPVRTATKKTKRSGEKATKRLKSNGVWLVDE